LGKKEKHRIPALTSKVSGVSFIIITIHRIDDSSPESFKPFNFNIHSIYYSIHEEFKVNIRYMLKTLKQ